MLTETIKIKIGKMPQTLIRAIGKGRDKFFRINFRHNSDGGYLTHGLTVTRHRKIFS